MRTRFSCAAAGLLALLLIAYANHFRNGFHFDDSHAIVDNPFVRDLRNIPRFFVDGTTFSILPLNQSYRPVLQATLAIDYRLGGGYNPVAFQVDTFLWFVALLLAAWIVFVEALRRSAVPQSEWVALAATALYGLHPVCAETVNYIIQRGDLLSTFGAVASLALFAARPAWRRSGAYLVFVGFAMLAKPPALVVPLLVALYVTLFEQPSRRRLRAAVRAAVPSAIVVAILLALTQIKTPPTFVPGATSKGAYWLTQPWVALRYFGAFFLPIDLSADNDWRPLTSSDPRVYIGIVFAVALFWAARAAARRRITRPIAFGLWWFVIALLPTSLLPLAEVANDHRMFFPFAGLALAVAGAAGLLWQRVPATRRIAAGCLVVLVLVAETAGVRARNRVWSSDEALWHDVTVKSPHNGRGLMNYGLALMERGNYATATVYFERALAYTPNYSLLHINLGIGYGATGRTADAEREFARAIALAPADWRSHMYYGRWLLNSGRTGEAIAQLSIATSQNPEDLVSRNLLARAMAAPATPESFLALSLADYQAGRYRDCIEHAKRALALRPGYAEAYNNIAAGHNALGEWDEGIRAAEEAVRLKPGFTLAQNNLAYARAQKARIQR